MIRSPRRRLVGAAAALMLLGATLLSTAGVAVASPPAGWSLHVTALPDGVTPGADAGYEVTISNAGRSNISQLYLVNDALHKGNPTYVGAPSKGSCTLPGVPLLCTFGALNAGTASAPNSVKVIVGFNTSGFASPFDPVLEATTGGVSFTDPNRSHGDVLVDSFFSGTTLVTDKNFGGGFNGSVGNSDQLNGQNKQSTKVTHLPGGIAATVEDGPTLTPDVSCASDDVINCNALIGEWSIINIAGGADIHPYFILQIHYKSGTPSAFVHTSVGHVQEDILPCGAGDFSGGDFVGTKPCFTWDARTSTATLYLFHNGGIKGA